MTTYPTYRSPIQTFQELGLSVDSIDSSQLKFERKRLLLEIQISDTQTTTFAEKELSKNDVIQLFDELERVSHLDYHRIIYDHPGLVDFLENSTVSKTKKVHFDTLAEQEEFVAFISPYMANAIDKLLSRVIRKNNFKDLETIQPFFRLVTVTDAFFAFRKFNNYCETLEERLDNLRLKKTSFPKNDVLFLKEAAFYSSVNALANFYPNLPDTVATGVINFTVNTERTVGRKKNLVEISDQLYRLNCSAELKTIISGNRNAFWESRENAINFDSSQIWRVLIGLILIGSFIFRASRCESSREGHVVSPEYQKIIEQVNSFQQDGLSNYRITTISDGTSNFDESSFLDLHEKVLESTKFSNYGTNVYPTQGEGSDPSIISAFKTSSTESTCTLTNRTISDMVMVVWADSTLTSYYVESGSTINFSGLENSSVFFYSGRNWKDDRTIEHMHIAPKNKSISLIRFNGYFSLWTVTDIEFIKKYFSFTDGTASSFFIKKVNSKYEFYQGDRLVNYSF